MVGAGDEPGQGARTGREKKGGGVRVVRGARLWRGREGRLEGVGAACEHVARHGRHDRDGLYV
jgi:hypothetical protein